MQKCSSGAIVSVGDIISELNRLATVGGPQGVKGDKGDKGDQGHDGVGIDIEAPVLDQAARELLSKNWTDAETGKAVLQTDTGEFWVYHHPNWIDGGHLTGALGPQGPKGNDGQQGVRGVQGNVGPSGISLVLKGRDTEANIKAITTSAPGEIWIVEGGPLDGHAMALNPLITTGNQWEDKGQFKGDKGDQGDRGAAGIKGDQGPRGLQGAGLNIIGHVKTIVDLPLSGIKEGDAYLVTTGTTQGDLYVYGYDGKWHDTGHIQGPRGHIGFTGSTGASGRDGVDGVDGKDADGLTLKGHMSEHDIKAITHPKIGDIWIMNALDSPGWHVGDALVWTRSGSWHNVGTFKGDRGPAGHDGMDGNPGIQGVAGPAGTGVTIKGTATIADITKKVGKAGDMWLVLDPGSKHGHGMVSDGVAAGANHWTDVGAIRGEKGDAGAHGTGYIIRGTKDESDIKAQAGTKTGDIYIMDKVVTSGYKPGDGLMKKADGSWANIGMLRGTRGLKGTDGLNGAPGTNGAHGKAGAAGPRGPEGQGIHPDSAKANEAAIRAIAKPLVGEVHIALDSGSLWIYDNPQPPHDAAHADWHNLGVIRGPQGLPGVGVAGHDGVSMVLMGTKDTTAILKLAPVEGNIWMATGTKSGQKDQAKTAIHDGDGIICRGGKWLTVGQIRGKKGLPGARGSTGAAGHNGAPGKDGKNGTSGSADTGAQILAKLKTVDGAGSGLDSDLLDGKSSTYFAAASKFVKLDGTSVMTGDLSTKGTDPKIKGLKANGGEIWSFGYTSSTKGTTLRNNTGNCSISLLDDGSIGLGVKTGQKAFVGNDEVLTTANGLTKNNPVATGIFLLGTGTHAMKISPSTSGVMIGMSDWKDGIIDFSAAHGINISPKSGTTAMVSGAEILTTSNGVKLDGTSVMTGELKTPQITVQKGARTFTVNTDGGHADTYLYSENVTGAKSANYISLKGSGAVELNPSVGKKAYVLGKEILTIVNGLQLSGGTVNGYTTFNSAYLHIKDTGTGGYIQFMDKHDTRVGYVGKAVAKSDDMFVAAEKGNINLRPKSGSHVLIGTHQVVTVDMLPAAPNLTPYLTKASATSTYQTKTAMSTYETKSHAAGEYLTKANGLTKLQAVAAYEQKDTTILRGTISGNVLTLS